MRKKILFLLDGPYPNLNAGGALVDKIIRYHGINNFSIIGLRESLLDSEFPVEYDKIKIKTVALRFPKNSKLFKVMRKFPLIETIFIQFRIFTRLNDIISFARDQKSEILFTILRGDALLVINKVKTALNIPLVAFDTDTVESEFNDHYLIYWQKKNAFYKALLCVSSLATIGESMHDLYFTKFNIDSIILRLPLKRSKQRSLKIINRKINIIFLGNIYAKKELTSFIKALDVFLSQEREFTINFYIATHKPINTRCNLLNCVNLGGMPTEELSTYLEECHIAYLPYKFDLKFKHQMKYAFPNKSGQYINNNIPIFFHGPSYSSFNKFLERFLVGVSCDSIVEKDIIRKFQILIDNKEFYKKNQNECVRAYKNEFSEEVFEERINRLFV